MAERYPGGVISKTPPTVTPTVGETIGSASGVWTLDTVLEYEKAGAWPKRVVSGDRLYAWGGNNLGDVGDNTTINKSNPVQIGALLTWEKVSAGGASTAIKQDGTLWSWGYNAHGRLGLNIATNSYRSSPTQVGALTNWGEVKAALTHCAAVKTDNTLWTWGRNNVGQLGQNIVYTLSRSSPVQVGSLTDWSKIDTSALLTVAIKTNGTIWAMGQGLQGSIGNNANINRSSPVQVGALTNWSQIACGYRNVLAVTSGGALWAWGYNIFGQLGLNDAINRSSPVQVGVLTTWDKVSGSSTNSNTSFAIKTDGTLWSWGQNNVGQLGDNTAANRSSPVQIGALTVWSEVSAGGNSAFSIKNDGTLWAWGRNNVGQLGDNTTVYRSSPVQIGGLTSWYQAASGSAHSLGITKVLP